VGEEYKGFHCTKTILSFFTHRRPFGGPQRVSSYRGAREHFSKSSTSSYRPEKHQFRFNLKDIEEK